MGFIPKPIKWLRQRRERKIAEAARAKKLKQIEGIEGQRNQLKKALETTENEVIRLINAFDNAKRSGNEARVKKAGTVLEQYRDTREKQRANLRKLNQQIEELKSQP